MSIGKNIKKYREQMGMTQKELAQKLGYTSYTTIGKIESGANDLTLKKLKEFADALNVSVSRLIDDHRQLNVATWGDNEPIVKNTYSPPLSDKDFSRIGEILGYNYMMKLYQVFEKNEVDEYLYLLQRSTDSDAEKIANLIKKIIDSSN